MRMEEYLNMLTEQIRCARAREPVRREIQAHIEDQTEAFLSEGMSEEEAREAAVQEMGDPVAVGADMDRLHRPKMPWRLLVFSAVLGAAGLLIQYYLQCHFHFSELPGTADISYGRQFLYLSAGILIMFLMCRLDYSRIGYYSREIYLVLFALLLLGMVVSSEPVNGTVRWIVLPFDIRINVTMMVLLFVPLYAAILYFHRGQSCRGMARAAVRWMLPALFLAWVCASVYTMLLLFLAFLVIFTVAVCRDWFRVSKKAVITAVYAGTLLLAAGMAWYTMNYGADYQAARLQSYFASGGSTSYQASLLRSIVAESRWIGPASDAVLHQISSLSLFDYTLAYITACCGKLAAILAIFLILFLILKFFRLARQQKNQMGMLMGVGGSTVFLLQWLLYLTEHYGITMLGSYCPFLTYGGSGMLVTYALAGLMLSICRYENTFPEAELCQEEEERRGAKHSIVFSMPVLLFLVLALCSQIGKV